jgi:beta-aspartyl-peptidase (threonine type)
MLRPALLAPLLLLSACATTPAAPSPLPPAPGAVQAGGPVRWGLVIHGGAGNIAPEMLSPERQAEYRATLAQALGAGHAVLAKGGSSLDAVVAAVTVMEDSPLFNAGKGAVFTHEGKNELDAAIMDGPTLAAGSVAGLRRVRNPIVLARRVMEKSPHVMMVGEGAEAFAQAQGVELVDPQYFWTEPRWRALQKALEEEKQTPVPAASRGGASNSSSGSSEGLEAGEYKFGTVGAVALDKEGRLAAATSTGGMTNKRFGRVGDAPIIGAGTYASATCGVSATGHGEYFIRYTVAHDVCARALYQGVPLAQAADAVVMDTLAKAGGEGGIIAMDGRGNVALPFNSKSMYRGYVGADGVPQVAVFKEPLAPAR